MNVVLWVAAGLLAAVFLGAGLTKIAQPKEKLATTMAWTVNQSATVVKLLGTAEVLGAVGLILPGALGIAPVLVPLAAVGLAVIMIGAVVIHARRHETPALAFTILLLVLAALVAWGRFGPYSFSS